MARYDGGFRPANAKPLEIEELLALLDGNTPAAETVRDHARACYLSSSEGWQEAVEQLGGTFAEEAVAAAARQSVTVPLTSTLQNIFNGGGLSRSQYP